MMNKGNSLSRVVLHGILAGTISIIACSAPPGEEGTQDDSEAVAACSFKVSRNTYDGSNYWGTITFKNGSKAVSGITVEFDVADGAHCTNDSVPSGATLSPLNGQGASAVTKASHCIFTWANASLGSGATKTFNYSADSSGFSSARNVEAHFASCGGTPTPPPPPPPPPGGPPSTTPLGQYVMTWYSFQDNTPVNSSQSSSGRELKPYISVAVPFRLLKSFGGTFNYGDKLYIEYLHGKKMPNGKTHTGWVEIDDFCGDNNDDSYCFQTVGGKKYPNTDLYIGDFTKSGMSPSGGDCSGPAGSGQELTNVSKGNPGSQWIDDYGGAALGTGKCGDYTSSIAQQGGAHGGCWDYTPPKSSVSFCKDCTKTSCSSW